MEWISVIDELPENDQRIFILRGKDCVQVATFKRGKYYGEMDLSKEIRGQDQHGNNLVPYLWEADGPGSWFGQDILYWSPMPNISEELCKEIHHFGLLGRQEGVDYILNNKKW